MSKLELIEVIEIEPETYKAIKLTEQNIRQVCDHLCSLGATASVRVGPLSTELSMRVLSVDDWITAKIGYWVVFGKSSFAILKDQQFRHTFREAR